MYARLATIMHEPGCSNLAIQNKLACQQWSIVCASAVELAPLVCRLVPANSAAEHIVRMLNVCLQGSRMQPPPAGAETDTVSQSGNQWIVRQLAGTWAAELAEVLTPCTAECSVLAMVAALVRLRLAALLLEPSRLVRDGTKTAASSCKACRHTRCVGQSNIEVRVVLPGLQLATSIA